MTPKFAIGNTVFHVLPDGERGVILDIAYHYLLNYHTYQVTFGIGRTEWCYESEISLTRKF